MKHSDEDRDVDDLAAALDASVVIPLGPKGKALSIADSLALREWFDQRRREHFGSNVDTGSQTE